MDTPSPSISSVSSIDKLVVNLQNVVKLIRNKRIQLYLLAFLIRLPFLMFFWEYWDGFVFENVVKDWFNYGLTPYDIVKLNPPWIYLPVYPYVQNWYAYPPGFFLVMTTFYQLYLVMPVKGEMWARFFIKLPIALGDLAFANGMVTYLKERNYKGHYGSVEKTLLFNPFIILIGDMWGMFDILVLASIIYSLIYLERKKLKISGVFYGLSILLKQTAALIFPFLAIYILKKYGSRKFIAYLASSATTVLAVILYFVLRNWDGLFYQVILVHLKRPLQGYSIPAALFLVLKYGFSKVLAGALISLKLKNISIIMSYYDRFVKIFTSTVTTISTYILLVIYAYIFGNLVAIGEKIDSVSLNKSLFIVYAAFTLFNKVSNEQYFIYPFAFYFIYSSLKNEESKIKEMNKVLYYLILGAVFLSLRMFLFLPTDIANVFSSKSLIYLINISLLGNLTPIDYLLVITIASLILISIIKLWDLMIDSLKTLKPTSLNLQIGSITRYLGSKIKYEIAVERFKLAFTVIILIVFIADIAIVSNMNIKYSNNVGDKLIAFKYKWYLNPTHDSSIKAGDWINSTLTPIEGYYDSNKEYIRRDVEAIKSLGGNTIILSDNFMNRQSLARCDLISEIVEDYSMSFALSVDLVSIYNFAEKWHAYNVTLDSLFQTILNSLSKSSYLSINGFKIVFIENVENLLLSNKSVSFLNAFFQRIKNLIGLDARLLFDFIIKGPIEKALSLLNEIKLIENTEISYLPNEISVEKYISELEAFHKLVNASIKNFTPVIAAEFLGDPYKTIDFYKQILQQVVSKFGAKRLIFFSWNDYSNGYVIEPTKELNDTLMEITQQILGANNIVNNIYEKFISISISVELKGAISNLDQLSYSILTKRKLILQ